MIKNLRLETQNLIVRPYTKNDVQSLYDVLNDEKVLAYIPEEAITLKEAQDAVDWLIENYELDLQADYKYSFAIETKKNHEYIGWCGFGNLDYDKSKKEIYFTLKSSHWGHGYATEAAKALLDYIFDVVMLEELVAVVKPENRASCRVIEKLGFKYESTVKNLPEQFEFYQGENYYILRRQDR